MVHIPTRFSGPIGFANGGWAAGLIAQESGLDPAEVTLRRPIPLDTDLRLDDGRVLDGDHVIAEVRQGEFHRDIPGPVTIDEAIAAEQRTLVRVSSEYGLCVVCGTERADGYRLQPGPIAVGSDTVACRWQPSQLVPALPAGSFVPAAWAAMDCPGAWTIDVPLTPMLLGRMTGTVNDIAEPVGPYVIVGRFDDREGRKMWTSTAIYDAAGTLLGHSEQLWITIAKS